MIVRILLILGGLFVLYVNAVGGTPETVLGLYPLDSAQRIGYDFAKAAIYCLGGWLIYRGIRPKQKKLA